MLSNIDPDYLADLDLNIMGREVSNTQITLGVAAAAGAFFLWRRSRGALSGFWDYDRPAIRPGPWATKTTKRCVRLKRSRRGQLVCAEYVDQEVLSSDAAYESSQYRITCKKYRTLPSGKRRCVLRQRKYYGPGY